jgi:hypothetical protein
MNSQVFSVYGLWGKLARITLERQGLFRSLLVPFQLVPAAVRQPLEDVDGIHRHDKLERY